MTCRFSRLSGFPFAAKCSKTRRNRTVALTIKGGLFHANCHDWHGLCGAGVRRLLCRFRPPGHLRRQGRRQDRSAAPRRDPDLRARARRAGGRPTSRPSGSISPPISTAPVAEADAVFIAVGTPSRRGDGHADLSYVYAAAREIAAALSGFTVVVTKSTVPVGTGDEVERLIREVNPSADVVVASNPEFLREGAAIRDFKFPDRIVVGTVGRARAQGARRHLPAAVAQPGAADVHGAAHRGTDQIRGQRVPRHQDHLHQRDRRSLPKRSAPTCRKSRAASGSTTASARNSCMPVRASAAPASRRTPARWSRSRRTMTCSCASSKPCSAVNDNRKRAMARKVVECRRRQPARQDRRRARPHLQARHRRHARGAVDPAGDRPARHGRESARARSGRHGAGAQANCPISNIATTPMPACAAPTPW